MDLIDAYLNGIRQCGELCAFHIDRMAVGSTGAAERDQGASTHNIVALLNICFKSL